MQQMQGGDNMNKENVVSFEREAEFYFDLGYKYINTGKLKKALRYLEKAVGIKPEDSYIQFNYAGILAELGDIERSTEVLLHIIKKIDANYVECYFGLACNYLQLQKIKKAIEYFTLYMEKDPDGEYFDESEDLLEMLYMIKEANNNLDDDELEKIFKIEEEAIKHLERKEYDKAVKKFESVVEILPNAVPARNNLSLTYYYQGNIEKAIEMAKELLNYEEKNIHANCNLAIFYNKLNIFNLVEKQIKIIRALITDNEEYLYKIADTFGSLSKHSDAYKSYKMLLRIDDENSLYLQCAAVAAYNSKKINESIKLWERLKEQEPENFLSDYFIDRALKTMDGQKEHSMLMYVYQLPKEEISQRIDRIYKFIALPQKESKEMLSKDESVIGILNFGINFDRHVLRKLIYDKIRNDNLVEAEYVLRKYLLDPEVENYIKIESVFLLNKLKAKEPYSIFVDGEIRDITIDPLSFPESEWKKEWEAVKQKAYQMMKGQYKSPYRKIVEDIWYDFIRSTYPDVPKITKIEVWAAAVEYAYCRFYRKETTQQELADKYNISKSSLGEKFRILYNSIAKKNGRDV